MQWGLNKVMQVDILLIFAGDVLWILISDWWTQQSVRFQELYSSQPLGEDRKGRFYFWSKCWWVHPRFLQPANPEICICDENRTWIVQIKGEKLAFVRIGAPPPSHLGLGQAHLEAFEWRADVFAPASVHPGPVQCLVSTSLSHSLCTAGWASVLQ